MAPRGCDVILDLDYYFGELEGAKYVTAPHDEVDAQGTLGV